MPFYVIFNRDAPGSAQKRNDLLQEHLASIKPYADQIMVAGPNVDSDGTYFGSFIVLEAADRDAALAKVKGDPYYDAGVWQSVEVLPFNPILGQWIKG